ncbi:MAG: hypothetical protein PVH77_01970 [Phycisphaerales bacterium]|jgi:hypothetical protein
MKLNKPHQTTLFLLMIIMAVVLAGCVATENNVHYTGVESSHLRQIERGSTTKDELLAIVGEPTEQSMTEDGAEILRYACKEIKDSKFAMFPPPIAIEDKKEKEHTVAFELKDGIVQRYWEER